MPPPVRPEAAPANAGHARVAHHASPDWDHPATGDGAGTRLRTGGMRISLDNGHLQAVLPGLAAKARAEKLRDAVR